MKCSNKRCKTCPAVIDSGRVISSSMPICKTYGIIYMIICGKCNVKYIGQSGLPLNLRINNHRKLCKSEVFSIDYNIQSKYEFDHFKVHSFSNIKIDILDIVPDNSKRLELENSYILKHKTAYPFGLNDRVNNLSVTSIKKNICIYKNIFDNNNNNVQKNNRIRSKNRCNKFIDFNVFLEEINDDSFKQNDMVKYLKGKILGLKKSKCKAIIEYVRNFKFKYSLIKDLIWDLLKFKLNEDILHTKPNEFKSYLVIDFSHKYIDLLNISQLLHDQNLINLFPVKETYPKVSFRYSPTIGSSIFNYVKFSKEVRVDDINNYPCTCNANRFKDAVHNHVVTGSLDIIDDIEIKSIFGYGSKFRLIPNLDVNKILEDFNNSLNKYINYLSFKLNLHFGYFAEWKNSLIYAIHNKINVTYNIYPSTISFRRFNNKIKELQNKYVIVPVDKASNNFGFICKRYYAQLLANEINSSSTFESTNVSFSDIRDNNIKFLKKYKILPSSYNIPFVYAIPKFHKTPTGFRFITSSFNCINKDISIVLNLILDELSIKIDNECENSWIIKNNKKVLESLEQCNGNSTLPGNYMVATFDFSSLYTTLPHDDLIHRIVALSNKYFDSEIKVTYNNNNLVITKSQFVEILKFCINNSFIKFNNQIYRQKVGIPMGANFSPNIANLYLHYYESKFLDVNPPYGRLRYSLTFRYIDDLLSVNNRDILFDINAIYHGQLAVSNTNSEPHRECSFLDIDVKIVEGKFVNKVYDKRREFNFDILGLPSFISNIPYQLTYSVLCSQFGRFAWICSYGQEFIFNCQLFVDKLLLNGFPSHIIKKHIYKFEQRKLRTLTKFNFNSSLINQLQFT